MYSQFPKKDVFYETLDTYRIPRQPTPSLAIITPLSQAWSAPARGGKTPALPVMKRLTCLSFASTVPHSNARLPMTALPVEVPTELAPDSNGDCALHVLAPRVFHLPELLNQGIVAGTVFAEKSLDSQRRLLLLPSLRRRYFTPYLRVWTAHLLRRRFEVVKPAPSSFNPAAAQRLHRLTFLTNLLMRPLLLSRRTHCQALPGARLRPAPRRRFTTHLPRLEHRRLNLAIRCTGSRGSR